MNMLSGSDTIHLTPNNERAKKLYRVASEFARRIDEQTEKCLTLEDVFDYKLEILRQKLRENCEKVILTDPFVFGKKSLELLWRKSYYDTISCAKKFLDSDSECKEYCLTMLIQCGIANFHNLLLKVSDEFNVTFDIDFPHSEIKESTNDEDLVQWSKSFAHSCLIFMGDLCRYQVELLKNLDILVPTRYYLQAANIDMTSGMPFNQLGNLYMNVNQNFNSVAYYLQCLLCSVPFEGGDGNLLRIFDLNRQSNEEFTANTAQKDEKDLIKAFALKFIMLIEAWYFKKEQQEVSPLCSETLKHLKNCLLIENNSQSNDTNNADMIESPSHLNHVLIYNLVKICCFMMVLLKDEPKKAFTVKAFTLAAYSLLLQRIKNELLSFGFEDTISKKRVNHSDDLDAKLKEKSSAKFVVENTNSKENEPVDTKNNELPKVNGTHTDSEAVNKAKKSKKVLKRRRRHNGSSSDSSGASESDSEAENLSVSEDNISDVDCSDDDDEYTDTDTNSDKGNNDDPDYIIEPDSPKKESANKNKFNIEKIELFLAGDNILPSIKLVHDWILTDTDLLKHSADIDEPILQSLSIILNMFLVYFYGKYSYGVQQPESIVLENAKEFIKKSGRAYKTIPLPEDTDLRGTSICKYERCDKVWDVLKNYRFSVHEENTIRMLKFMDFGFGLAKIINRLKFNKFTKVFFVKKNLSPKGKLVRHPKDGRDKKRMPRISTAKSVTYKHSHHHSQLSQTSKSVHEATLMRNLGKLWLQSQVRELESAVRNGGRNETYPAFIAIDTDALCQHTNAVKQLVKARKFVVLIPTVVLKSIDDLKKDDARARDAIRWLENQLHKGSRFLRTQRAHETKPVPLVKYPKKLSRATQDFIQIIEFCYHFVDGESSEKTWGAKGDPEASQGSAMLLLLTGAKLSEHSEGKEPSLSTIAAGGGIPHEYICHFMNRFRSHNRSHKKR